MSRSFWARYGATRVSPSAPQPPLTGMPEDENAWPEESDLDYEVDAEGWEAHRPSAPSGWRACEWEGRPIRFVDGKDVGETVACLTAPTGHPVPVRLSEIGGIVVRQDNGVIKRGHASVERVVSMAVDLFPWDEMEDLASSLQRHGFRLLPAQLPDGEASFDFEVMRKAAQNRSNTEMGVLEEAALAQENHLPTVVDGRLEPRAGGLDPGRTPAIGVVKSHHHTYLHGRGMQLLYQLRPGERTPVFAIRSRRSGTGEGGAGERRAPGRSSVRLEVASWYVRLAGGLDLAPNWGLVRVELPLTWFEAFGDHPARFAYVDRLTLLLREYRCRDASYARAPVSLHPIVRAEQLLGALFAPHAMLARRFYRVNDL